MRTLDGSVVTIGINGIVRFSAWFCSWRLLFLFAKCYLAKNISSILRIPRSTLLAIGFRIFTASIFQ